MPDEFEAEMDLETLLRAEKINRDSGRLGRAKHFAERKAESFHDFAERIPGKEVPVINGSPRKTSFTKRKK